MATTRKPPARKTAARKRTTTRAPLSVVKPGELAADAEKAPPAEPKPILTILQAVETDDAREVLVATRRVVAKALDDVNCPKRDLAALSRRLLEIDREIRAVDLQRRQEERDGVESPDEPFDETAI